MTGRVWRILNGIVVATATLAAGPIRANSSELVGEWKFVGYHYKGQDLPPMNADLVIHFSFDQDGTNRLLWYRKNEVGFCERMGRYSADFQTISEVIVWTNPANEPNCSQDPDMQIGRQQQISYRVHGSRLETDAPLSDEILTILWDRE